MPTKKKHRPSPVCTRYAVQRGEKFYGIGDSVWGTFDEAILFRTRAINGFTPLPTDVIVPVRCRALSARTKASKKRTR